MIVRPEMSDSRATLADSGLTMIAPAARRSNIGQLRRDLLPVEEVHEVGDPAAEAGPPSASTASGGTPVRGDDPLHPCPQPSYRIHPVGLGEQRRPPAAVRHAA